MDGKAMQRARRTARSIPQGAQILDLLAEAEMRAGLVAAAEAGYPPVSAVSTMLTARIDGTVLKPHATKQFIGLCVRAILEEEGFAVAQTGVRLSHDGVFRTGATYQKKKQAVDIAENHSLLRRFIASLNQEELEFATDYIKTCRNAAPIR